MDIFTKWKINVWKSSIQIMKLIQEIQIILLKSVSSRLFSVVISFAVLFRSFDISLLSVHIFSSISKVCALFSQKYVRIFHTNKSFCSSSLKDFQTSDFRSIVVLSSLSSYLCSQIFCFISYHQLQMLIHSICSHVWHSTSQHQWKRHWQRCFVTSLTK